MPADEPESHVGRVYGIYDACTGLCKRCYSVARLPDQHANCDMALNPGPRCRLSQLEGAIIEQEYD